MSKSSFPANKIAASEKARHYALEHIPDVLGGNFYGFERLRVLSGDGKLVIKYKNTGSLVLGNIVDKDTKTVKSTAQIIAWEVSGPFVYSVQDNDSLQVINTETGTNESFSPKTSLFPLKKTQALFVKDDNVFCVAPAGVLIFDQKALSAAPREIPLVDVKDKSTRTIINVNGSYSTAITTNRLLLANNDVFQVWNVNKDKKEMFLEFEGRNSASTIKYLNLWHFDNTVVTTSRGAMSLWQIDKPKDSKNPKDLKEEALITELYMDDSFVITGDNVGNISLRQRSDGEKVYDMSAPDPISPRKDEKEKDSKLLDFNLENKINSLTKVGRWVVAAYESGKLTVFDVMKEKSPPIAEYTTPKGGSISGVYVDAHLLLASFKPRPTSPTEKKSKDKDTASVKPEIVAWAPKLSGLEYYVEANKDGKDSIACILAWAFRQITGYIKAIEKEGEDTTELSTTMDRLEDSISQTRRYPELAVQFFQSIRKLQMTLDSYEGLLEKLTQQGRLVRMFTSSRLRRDLEYQNSVVGTNVIELELRIKTTLERKASAAARPTQSASFTTKGVTIGSSANVSEIHTSGNTFTKATPTRQSMIQEVKGRDFWRKNWGDALNTPWEAFVECMKKEFTSFTEADQKQMHTILDYSNTGSVSQYKFAEFLKGFGPFENCVDNVRLILNEPWFHGFLNGRESELLMKNQYEPDGTFLVRFSKSKPGSFALAFLKDGIVNHILIESFMPDGFKVLTQDTSGPAKLFKTLHELVNHYSFVLKYPFHSDLPKRDWFHGDLTTEEAVDSLTNQPAGTFLLRFSRKGTFAASFVDTNSSIRHVLIETEGKNNFVVDTGNGVINFPSIPDLVQYYTEKMVFLHPLISGK